MRPVNNGHPPKSSFMHEVGLIMRYALGVEGFVAKGSIIVEYVISCDILLLKGNIANNRETASLDMLDRLNISLSTICASGELLRVQENNKFSRTLKR